VPITFVLSERKRHSVTLNAAYSSDLGGSGGVTWGDRNVFGNAEQLNVSASIINLGGSDTTGLGYDTRSKFLIPDFEHRDQSLQFAVGAIKQYLVAYDQKAVTGGVTLTRKLSSVWTVSAGLATTEEQIMQDSVTRDYTLVALPLTVSYDSTHLASPLDDPRHGMRDSLSITPTESLGHPNATFIISQIKIAAYVDFSDLGWGDPGRNIVAFRALAGLAQGAGEFSLPPDQRFYAGGSSTIRGYPYQQVGALFPYTTIPIGGTAIAAGTVEFRKRFAGNWGGAIFADAGQVSEKLQLLPSEVRVGVGIGVRYYTSIGPIRIDVAAPTKRDIYQEPNAITPAPSACVGKPAVTAGCFTTRGAAVDQTFQVYIGLGQAF
jgi:translocation and assembly module TamA